MKLTLKLLVYILLIPVFIIFKLISIFICIRIKEIPTKRIGHLAIENNNYLFYRKFQKYKSIDFFFPEKFISNHYLLSLFKKKMIILPRLFLGPIFNMNGLILKLFGKKNSFNFPKEYFVPRDVNNFIEKYEYNIFIPSKDAQNCQEILKKLGIKKNDKVVCIILRDDLYLKKTQKTNNFDYHSYRNFNNKIFLKSIQFLLDNSYYVFRMGKIVEERLKINHSHFIDFPFSEIQSEVMDVYLAKRCEFVISSGTGWHEIPTIFNKPILHLTASLGTSSSYKTNNIFLTKRFKINGKLLTLKDIFNLEISYYLSAHEFKKNSINYEDASEDQILSSVKQMIKLIKNNFLIDNNEKALQSKYQNLFNHSKVDVNGNIFHKKINSKYNLEILKSEFKNIR